MHESRGDQGDERNLVAQARKDPSAFGVLFDRYYPAIYGYVLRRVGKWNDAQDITSEVFLKALTALSRYRWTGVPFSAWLYRIATREVGMYFRRARRAHVSLNWLMDESGFDAALAVDLRAERLEAEQQLERLTQFRAAQSHIATLPLKYQDVLALRFFERKSIGEIAEILGKKPGTVKSLISRGVARLKKLM